MVFDNAKLTKKSRELSPMSNKRKVIASVQNALNLLNLFQGNTHELGNTDIAHLLKMNPSTVAGLVYTLKENNYLDQNPKNKKYRLGLKIVERGFERLRQMDILEISSPYLESLRDWSGESVNLGIMNDREVVYIKRLSGHHNLDIRPEIGKRAPIHSTALGKAITAFLPENELREHLKKHKFKPITQFTITTHKALNNDLEKVREIGYSIDEQENELGGFCIGAPIFDFESYPVAAISISVPIQRLPKEKIQIFGEKLKSTALEISKEIGYNKTINSE